jgi:hypothetical protein
MPVRSFPEPVADDEGARWLISFVDLVSLLLTFMILAFALAGAHPGSWPPALAAIRDVFLGRTSGNLPAEIRLASEVDGPRARALGYVSVLLRDRLALAGGPVEMELTQNRSRLSLLLPPGRAADETVAALAPPLAAIGNPLAIEVEAALPAGGPADAVWQGVLDRAARLRNALRASGIASARIELVVSARPQGDEAPLSAPDAGADRMRVGIVIAAPEGGGR